MVTPKKFFSILVLFLCTALGAQAQKTVSGRVLNQDSVALQQATVLLYLANDSTPLRVVSTDQWGMFRFQADTARYVLQVLHMGYVPYEHALSVRGADQQTYIGDILLKESVKSLGEVSVSGEVERTVVPAKFRSVAKWSARWSGWKTTRRSTPCPAGSSGMPLRHLWPWPMCPE